MMPFDELNIPSFLYGMGVGAAVTVLLMMASIVGDFIASNKYMKREIRKAHDEGYADGRRWRGYEKAWLESNFQAIRQDIDEIRGR